jgi:pilus assembly protein CpaE
MIGHPEQVLRGTEYSSVPFSSTKVIAVYSSKGGVGKSTMSLNLAARLAHVTDLQVCVVDLDVGFGDIGPRLGKFSPTIIEALREPQLDGDSIMSKLVREDVTGMYALLAPLRPDTGADRSLLHPSAYDRVLRALRQRFHVVVLDCSVDLADPLVGQFALTRADSIAVVVNNERATLLDAKRALDAMCRPSQGGRPGLGIPPEKIGVLLNQKVDKVNVGERDIRSLLPDYPIIATIPDNRQLWVGETNLGRLLATANIPEIDEALDSALMALLPGLDLTANQHYEEFAPEQGGRGASRGRRGPAPARDGRGKGGLLGKLLGK